MQGAGLTALNSNAGHTRALSAAAMLDRTSEVDASWAFSSFCQHLYPDPHILLGPAVP